MYSASNRQHATSSSPGSSFATKFQPFPAPRKSIDNYTIIHHSHQLFSIVTTYSAGIDQPGNLPSPIYDHVVYSPPPSTRQPSHRQQPPVLHQSFNPRQPSRPEFCYKFLLQISKMNQHLADLQQSHDVIIASAQANTATCTASIIPPYSLNQPPAADYQSYNLQPAAFTHPPTTDYQTLQPPASSAIHLLPADSMH